MHAHNPPSFFTCQVWLHTELRREDVGIRETRVKISLLINVKEFCVTVWGGILATTLFHQSGKISDQQFQCFIH